MIVFHNFTKYFLLGNCKKKRNILIENFINITKNKFDFFYIKKIIIILFLIKKFLKNEIFNKKKILFVSTKNFLREIIYKYSRSLKQNYICNKWIGGILTNPKNYKKMLNKSIYLKNKKKMNFTKKEKNIFEKEINKIEILYGGLKNMKKNPDILFITDVKKDKIAINEAKRLKIKIIAFVDSDDLIKGIDYIIPFNNSSIFCVKNVLKVLFSELC